MRVHYCNEPWAPLSGWWPLASQATMGWGRAAAWPGPLSLSLFTTNSHAVPRRGPCGCGETLPPALSFVPWGAAGFPRFPEHRLSPGVPQPFPSLAPASAGSGHPHSHSPHVGGEDSCSSGRLASIPGALPTVPLARCPARGTGSACLPPFVGYRMGTSPQDRPARAPASAAAPPGIEELSLVQDCPA